MDKPKTQQRQVNIRLDDETLAQIDECRTELRKAYSNIPSRSDVVRMAIEEFLRNRGRRGGVGERAVRVVLSPKIRDGRWARASCHTVVPGLSHERVLGAVGLWPGVTASKRSESAQGSLGSHCPLASGSYRAL